MTPARFMEEISRWMDENVMAQVGGQKKADSKLPWNLPRSFMGDDYLISIFLVALVSSLGVSFGI